MPLPSRHPLDWTLLGRAAAFYESHGFTYIEVPWLVRSEITEITKPAGAENFSAPHGDLIGSAEQSFIQMMVDGKLPPGRWYTITPCFRDEPVVDDLHQTHFMKLELIDTLNIHRYWTYKGSTRVRGPNDRSKPLCQTAEHAMGILISLVQQFIRQEVGDLPLTVETQRDPKHRLNEQEDIMYGDVELGSYGIRHHKPHTWVYGTGCAEPRWSWTFRELSS